MEKVYEIHRTYTKSKSSHMRRNLPPLKAVYFLRLLIYPGTSTSHNIVRVFSNGAEKSELLKLNICI